MLALTFALAVSAAPQCRVGDAASCTKMCDAGEMRACVVLGSMYADAVGVDRNSKRANELFLKACGKGDGEGCNAEGARVRERLLDDAGNDAGWDVVTKWFDKACSEGSPKGCNNMAEALVDGRVANKSVADAVPLWRKGCELETEGSASSCLAYGQALARGTGVAADQVLAGKWLARACRLGAHEACSMAEDLGEHVVVTAESRARLLQAKCDAGDPKACSRVGFDLLDKNPAAARAPLAAACTADDARACTALGIVLLHDGNADAVARLGRACDLDEAHSCRVLADEILVGHVVARDEARAITLYKKGCALGEQAACKHESGIAMAKTLKRNGDGLVETVLRRPCKDGDADSCFALKGLGKPAKAEVVDASRAVAAVDETERACNAGDGRACFTAGKRAQGIKASELFDLGCRAGYPKACAESGARFVAVKDAASATDAFARGCSLGNAESCKAVAKLGDVERVRPLLAQACTAKVDGACDLAR